MPATSYAPSTPPRAQRCPSIPTMPTQPPISVCVLELAWHLEREALAASQAARLTERQPVAAIATAVRVAAWRVGAHRAAGGLCFTGSSRPPGGGPLGQASCRDLDAHAAPARSPVRWTRDH